MQEKNTLFFFFWFFVLVGFRHFGVIVRHVLFSNRIFSQQSCTVILLLPCPGSATLHFYGYPSFRFPHIYLLESKTAASTNVHKDRRIIVIPFRNRSADSKDSLTKGSERTNQIFRNYFNRFSFSFLVVVVKFGIFCVTFNNKNHSQTHTGKGKKLSETPT